MYTALADLAAAGTVPDLDATQEQLHCMYCCNWAAGRHQAAAAAMTRRQAVQQATAQARAKLQASVERLQKHSRELASSIEERKEQQAQVRQLQGQADSICHASRLVMHRMSACHKNAWRAATQQDLESQVPDKPDDSLPMLLPDIH